MLLQQVTADLNAGVGVGGPVVRAAQQGDRQVGHRLRSGHILAAGQFGLLLAHGPHGAGVVVRFPLVFRYKVLQFGDALIVLFRRRLPLARHLLRCSGLLDPFRQRVVALRKLGQPDQLLVEYAQGCAERREFSAELLAPGGVGAELVLAPGDVLHGDGQRLLGTCVLVGQGLDAPHGMALAPSRDGVGEVGVLGAADGQLREPLGASGVPGANLVTLVGGGLRVVERGVRRYYESDAVTERGLGVGEGAGRRDRYEDGGPRVQSAQDLACPLDVGGVVQEHTGGEMRQPPHDVEAPFQVGDVGEVAPSRARDDSGLFEEPAGVSDHGGWRQEVSRLEGQAGKVIGGLGDLEFDLLPFGVGAGLRQRVEERGRAAFQVDVRHVQECGEPGPVLQFGHGPAGFVQSCCELVAPLPQPGGLRFRLPQLILRLGLLVGERFALLLQDRDAFGCGLPLLAASLHGSGEGICVVQQPVGDSGLDVGAQSRDQLVESLGLVLRRHGVPVRRTRLPLSAAGGPAKASAAFQRGLTALAQWVAREGTDPPVPRGHSETITVDGGTEPVIVKLGVWVSNTKSRRDKLTAEQRNALRGLGAEWA